MKTLFLQFRENKNIAEHERKCFLKYIKGEVEAKNVFTGEFDFLKRKDFTHIILGGSGEFSISDRKKKPLFWEKTEKIIPFLRNAIDGNIHILGVCFGHQLLSFILGSEVKSSLKQKEVGSFRIYLTPEGKKDRLFFSLPSEFLVQEGHKDAVLKLPEGANLLAFSKRCKIQAFAFKNTRGVQFHPELKEKDIRYRLDFYSDYAPQKKKLKIKETPLASKVIENFYGI